MKTLLLIIGIFISYYHLNAQAQNLQGAYQVDGYFFHPTSPRVINSGKKIVQVSTNTYKVALGDVDTTFNYYFQFTVDSNNNLVNWLSVGSTPPSPSSNFMTTDNPGGVDFSVASPNNPGTPPWIISTYNNTYNPVTKTFYMHYGYSSGATGQNGFARQIYEKYVLASPPIITSFDPNSGTSGNSVTIKGKNFTNISGHGGVKFGNYYSSCDTFRVISDSVIQATVGSASSGKVFVKNNVGQDSLGDFTYTHPVVNNTQWQYVGNAGISANASDYINMDISKQNIPYVVYVDSVTSNAFVKKYSVGTWSTVGATVSDGKSSGTNIVIDKNDVPYVSFIDSANGGLVTVKYFNGSSWVSTGAPGFARADLNLSDLVLDTNNVPYVILDSFNSISVYKFNGSYWTNLGIVGTGYDCSIAINEIDNSLYVFITDLNIKPIIRRYNGSSWDIVGNADFTNNYAFFPIIKIDKTGKPIVEVQDDDGFERISVFKLNGNSWVPDGSEKFSKSQSYSPSLCIDKNNLPLIAFISASYNGNGTVMKLNNLESWNTVGVTGFAPAYVLSRHALAIDTNNVPLLAFKDINNGNKVSVMRFEVPVNSSVTISDGEWANPAIWLNGVVPTATSLVTVRNIVTVTADATCYSLKVELPGNLKVIPGINLIIVH